MPEGESTATCAPLLMGATDVLERNADPGLRMLRVDESESAVTISGTVTSYYLKQMAQEALMPILGHRELHNRVEVHRPYRKALPWEA